MPIAIEKPVFDPPAYTASATSTLSLPDPPYFEEDPNDGDAAFPGCKSFSRSSPRFFAKII